MAKTKANPLEKCLSHLVTFFNRKKKFEKFDFLAEIRHFSKGLALVFANFRHSFFQPKNALDLQKIKEINISRYFLSF